MLMLIMLMQTKSHMKAMQNAKQWIAIDDE